MWLAVSTQHGLAAENWDLCRIPAYYFVESDALGPAATEVEAQAIVSDDSEQLHLTGDVKISRARQSIQADEVLLDKATQRLQASGNVVFEDPGYRLQSPRITVDDTNQRAQFENPEFELRQRHARGQASQIEKLDSARSRFVELTYTSCDPDDRDWHLRAQELHIDDESGRGTAKHTTLYFKEVPFVYLPWFQFPVDDRRMSGMLAPRIGYSDSGGGQLDVPVYWNIAPNYDMTITPAWYDRRGLQLNTENRYLFAGNRGQFDFSYLDDDVVDDSRWFQRWQHDSDLGYDVTADFRLVEVSDGDFFDDFDNVAPEYNNTRHLQQHFSLRRDGDTWRSELSWQEYQTLDSATATENRPYDRLPRLTIAGEPRLFTGDFATDVQAEWVDFDRDDSVIGSRTNVVTSISWRNSQGWYFFEPELQLAFTDYQLDNNPADDSIDRSLPTLSIDSGLIFERPAGSRNQWRQTLEPRLYFLHTPFEDQDDIPDFDTSLASSTYNNLFRNNRFIGADRIGDAQQVTFGLGSRLYDDANGDELFHVRAGQIYYFKDRRVSLDGRREDESQSDVIAEIDVWPSAAWRISSRLVYDEDDGDLIDRDLSANYARDGFAANFGYYFTEDELEQALVSMVYPLNERWTLVAKIQRSILFDEPVENLLGLNYESCCWGLKILAGQTGDDVDDFADTDETIYFEITLKGLSQAGRDIDAQLRDAIPGYESSF